MEGGHSQAVKSNKIKTSKNNKTNKKEAVYKRLELKLEIQQRQIRDQHKKFLSSHPNGEMTKDEFVYFLRCEKNIKPYVAKSLFRLVVVGVRSTLNRKINYSGTCRYILNRMSITAYYLKSTECLTEMAVILLTLKNSCWPPILKALLQRINSVGARTSLLFLLQSFSLQNGSSKCLTRMAGAL